MIATFDTNGDGKLDIEEFAAFCVENPVVCETCSTGCKAAA